MLISLVLFSWYIYLVDPVGGASNIAFDTSGEPHIFYYCGSTAEVRHAWWNGNNFDHEVIDGGFQYYNGGPAAVIDNQNRIHLAYFTSDEHLGYGLYDGTWHLEIADTATKVGNFCDIALDQNNQPHIVHRRLTGFVYGYLRYTKKVSGYWETYEFGSEYGGYHPSIVFDSQDNPHIADCTDGDDLRYIVWDGADWQIEKPVLDHASSYSSLVLDSQDRPQISFYWAYYDENNFDLRFVEKNSGTWQVHIVDHGEETFKRGWDNEIAIDSDGVLHITYHAHNECLVKYATGSGSNWYLSTVDTVGMWYAFNAIGVNNSDDIFMSYCDSDGLWLATTRQLVGVEEDVPAKRDRSGSAELARFIRVRGEFKIYDTAGRLILSGNYPRERRVALSRPGVYFVKTEDYFKKIVLIH